MQIDLPNDLLSIINTDHKPSLKELKEYITRGHEWLLTRHRNGASGFEIVKGHTHLIDHLIMRLFLDARDEASARHPEGKERCSIIAIGGYGRGELNPYSDIDLLFLYPATINPYLKTLTEGILYHLWDLGLTVGFSTRTISDCVKIARSDLTARTALMDTRLIAGDDSFYAEMEDVLLREATGKGVDSFIKEKVLENEERHGRYGSSVYILEPNIKDGEGGLRDIHTALWVSKARFKAVSFRELMKKGVITPKELRFFERSTEFLFRVRNELHYLSGRKNDQMTFDYQEKIASFMGFKDTLHHRAVEGFMRGYYIYARNINQFSKILIRRASAGPGLRERLLHKISQRDIGDGFKVFHNKITVTALNAFEARPSLMMKGFEQSLRHGLPFNDFTEELIRKNLRLVDDPFRLSEDVNQIFLSILKGKKGVYETLNMMHDLRFLGKFIPEFGKTFCRVQHDIYHIYTLDTHSLFTVMELRRLLEGDYAREFPFLTEIAGGVENHHILVLAGLFHDIGKGVGKGHAEIGAEMARGIASRMGLPAQEIELLVFLVRRHLLMAHISQRRDISDERLILDFCKEVGDPERLRMLYLLTFADMRAVGPDVWTPWKGSLLEELYRIGSQVFDRKLMAERVDERAARRLKDVHSILRGEVSEPYLIDYFKTLPARYFSSNNAEDISEHIRMFKGLSVRPLSIEIRHNRDLGFSVVTICTLDIAGLFSKITGVMAANGVNILNAQVYTRKDGTVLDILSVNDPYGRLIEDEKKWEALKEGLLSAIEGRVSVDRLVARMAMPSAIKEKTKPRHPTVVEIDNLVSDTHTVIDIFANDRIGLLYSITSTLAGLGLYIDVAKISTRGDQAADVFYVKDIFGHKITDQGKLDKIKAAILEVV
ncbi:MAG: [protein-PII] uridylyltransferase [Deltaproteobacteria bacterium]|nr:[protein-PII] uridylyltransferase [Deltaproteobacteria bacterium]